MPVSTHIFKNEAVEFVKSKFHKYNDILDIGAGCGTYSKLLRDSISRMDAVEVFEPYVKDYGLRDLYRNVFVTNAIEFDFSFYNLIIAGDVLEHIDEEAGIEFISRIYSKCDDTLISVPFHAPQGEHFGNIYETHLQPDLSHNNFMEKYVGFKPLCLRYDFGVYVKDDERNSKLPIILEEETLGTIVPEYATTFKPYIQESFPDTEIITYSGPSEVGEKNEGINAITAALS